MARLLQRRAVAREWGIPPWEVDEAPHGEVLLTLQLLELEQEKHGGAQGMDGPDDG